MADYAFRIGDTADCEIQVRPQASGVDTVFRAEACVVDVDGWCETPIAHPSDPTLRLFVIGRTEPGAVGLMLEELQLRFGPGVSERSLPAVTTPRRVNPAVDYPPM